MPHPLSGELTGTDQAMPDTLRRLAEASGLDLPASTSDYTRDDWKQHNAVVDAWFEAQSQPPADGSVEVVDLTPGHNFGRVTHHSRAAQVEELLAQLRSSLRAIQTDDVANHHKLQEAVEEKQAAILLSLRQMGLLRYRRRLRAAQAKVDSLMVRADELMAARDAIIGEERALLAELKRLVAAPDHQGVATATRAAPRHALRRRRCGGGRPRARRIASRSAGGGSSGDPDEPEGEPARRFVDDYVTRSSEARR
jgi:hypothetical protein